MASVSDSTTCPGGQCILSFPTVPAGKQLVITNVFAQLGPASNQLVLEGNGVSFFVPKSDMNIGYLASHVTLYFEDDFRVRTGSNAELVHLYTVPPHLGGEHSKLSVHLFQ